MSVRDLAKIQDELYALPLTEFTGSRDARASEIRQAGDRDLASSVKRLRKPSVAAWLANMLVRNHGREIERLIGLGEDLRSARNLKGEAIREASKQKADSIRKLLRHAQAIADQTNQSVSQAALQEVEGTLDAAFSDADSAAELRAGHLSTTLRYSGLGFGGGSGPRSAAPGSPPGAGRTPPAGKSTAAARKALDVANREAARAESAADSARQAVVSAEAELKRLRAALTVADRQAKKARDRASAAQKKVDTRPSALRR